MPARATIWAALLLCGGCSQEPGFNEAFNAQGAAIEQRAATMQNELSNQMNAVSAAGPNAFPDNVTGYD